MLGVLAALGAALRPLGGGTAGVETVFVLLVIGGRVFGPGFGFVLGPITLFASALITGGVGPWLPFQMLAASWVGLGAGLLPPMRGRAELVLLAAYGAVAAVIYGLAMNLWFWPFALGLGTELSYAAGAPVLENLQRFAVFSVATSLGWDIGRAVTTVILVALLGPAVMGALRRAARRSAFAPAGRTVAQ
jgi:energy-coupling factor transport system substrate-specific component